MTQVSRPEADIYYPVPPPNGQETDSWRNELGEIGDGLTTFGLFESINTFLPNDETYAEAGPALGVALPEKIVPYVTKLSVVETPSMSSEGLTIKARLAKDIAAGKNVSALLELREEYNNETTDLGILIASATFPVITSVFQEYSFQATPAQASNILDFDALYLRIVFTYE